MTQGQSIDWVTSQVEPGIAWQTDWFSVEYSRTMRSFQQDDQVAFGDFRAGVPAYGLGAVGYSNWASENYTEIDRVKVWSQIAPDTDLYVLGWVGNTHNKLRESDRKFYGVDGRITNQSIDGLTATAYAKSHVQNNSADTQSLNSRYPGDPYFLEPRPPQQMFTPNDNYLGLVDREWTTIGLKNRWRPFYDSWGIAKGFALVGGYEWAQIARSNVTYNLDNLVPFTQPTTVSNMFFAGVQEDWSPALNTFLRYRVTTNSWPIVGITERHQLSLDAAINSNQPERVGQVEMGGTWSVADDLMINGMFWIENSYNHSRVCQLLRDGLSVHAQCLVHAECVLVVCRGLRQSDELDHPGHHAGPRRRWRRRTAGLDRTVELHGQVRSDQSGGQLCGVGKVAADEPAGVRAGRELLPATAVSTHGYPLLRPAGLQRGGERYLPCHGRVRLFDPTADRRVRPLQFLRLHRRYPGLQQWRGPHVPGRSLRYVLETSVWQHDHFPRPCGITTAGPWS